MPEWPDEARARLEAEADERRRLEKWESELPDTRRRIAALPEPLAARMDFFLSGVEGWGPNFGAYELFCCEQGALIARTLKSKSEIIEFAKLPWEAQVKRVPISDHSRNTFGCAVRLALRLATRADLVVQVHGAMCPLVGCESYGCWAARSTERK